MRLKLIISTALSLAFLANNCLYAANDIKPFTLAAAVTPPGGGGPGGLPCGTSTEFLNPVLMFHFHASQPLEPSPSISPCPTTSLNDPIYLAFDNRGELFVSNRHGNQEGKGSISRFIFDKNGNPIENGVITHASLSVPHGLAFSPKGELFVKDYLGGLIVRFLFGPRGEVIPNGSIDAHEGGLGITFNRKGELFFTSGPTVHRYVFDPATGEAVSNGSFSILEQGEQGALHALAFNAKGELFIVEPFSNRIYRYRFDAHDNPIYNGYFSTISGPIGLSFSPVGELFVGSHFAGGIMRYVFDANGNAEEAGFVQTPTMGGLAVYPSLH